MDNRPTRPYLENRKGRVLQELRREGRELVDEDRLTTLFMDLFGNLENDEPEARAIAQEAMRILRG